MEGVYFTGRSLIHYLLNSGRSTKTNVGSRGVATPKEYARRCLPAIYTDPLLTRPMELDVSPSPPPVKRGRPAKATKPKHVDEEVDMELDNVELASYE